MQTTSIQWAQTTWNPVTGCTKVSAGCQHCYAERMARRLRGRGVEAYKDGFKVTLHPERLRDPYRWLRPSVVFVCSMGDLFHADVPDEFIASVYGAMSASPRHRFIVLTKRIERAADWLGREYLKRSVAEARHLRNAPEWPPPNVVLGCTAEDQAAADERIPHLLQAPAACRMVSIEPMLGPVDLVPFLPPSAYTLGNPEVYEPAIGRDPHSLRKGVGGACFRTLEEATAALEDDNLPDAWFPDLGYRLPGRAYGLHGRIQVSACSPAESTGCRKLAAEARIIRLRSTYLDWVICGGETGPSARKCERWWGESLLRQCRVSQVPFFLKSWGQRSKGEALIDGVACREVPVMLTAPGPRGGTEGR